MIGKIIIVPGPGGAPGFLAANHGRNFSFTSAGWQAPSVVPTVGRQVEFEPRATHAVNVRPTGPFHGRQSAPGSAAGQAQRQAHPPPGRQPKLPRSDNHQQRSKRSHGSMTAAMRSMMSILLITPLTVPIFFIVPIIGRLEIISTVLLAGFLGGHRAGGLGKALISAVLVGSAHGFVVYVMFLVGLQLILGLPHAGGYADTGIGFVGGITVVSSIGAVVVALPVFLILVVSSVMGALTAKI